MKKLIHTSYIFLFLISASSIVAQPSWQWGKNVRLISGNIALDNMGNSYVTWPLSDTYDLDGHVFNSQGLNDIALTSFDCNGNYRWTKTIGGPGDDSSVAVRTDSLGGVYLVGTINAIGNWDVNISNDTIFSGYSFKGMFLVKYDTDGDFQWFRMPEDTAMFSPTILQLGRALDMDVAPNGDCYIYSRLSPGTYGGGVFEATYYQGSYSSNNGEDIYALKYGPNGNCTGGIHLNMYYSGSSPLVNTKYKRDNLTGRFYATGFRSSIDDIVVFGNDTINSSSNYVVQFDSLGYVNWTQSTNDFDNPYTGFVGKPSTDDSGNVFVTGFSYNGNSFSDFTFQNVYGNSGFPIIAKIDINGTVVFATNASTNSGNSGTATAYSNGQVGVTGHFGNKLLWGNVGLDNPANTQGFDAFLAIFDADSSGFPNSFNALFSAIGSVEYTSYLTADNQGNFYIGGKFSSTLYVADDTLYNQTGTSEGFIAKFGSDSCYCPMPVALFSYDTIPNQDGYTFAYTGIAGVDSVVWDFGDGQSGVGVNPSHLFAQSGTYTVCATAYNSCGIDSVCINIAATGPDAVKVINGFEKIRLYPNPAQEWLNIANAESGTRVDVISAVGMRLYSSELQTSPAQIDVSALPPGVYLLQLTDRSGRRGYARFVKE